MGSAQPIGNLTVTSPACVIIMDLQTKNIGRECAAPAAAATRGSFETVLKSSSKACTVSGFALSSEDTQ